MGENTKIEWATHTFNPWIGCSRVSPGCQHCYAESLAKRTKLVEWGPQAERHVTSDASWRQPLKWAKQAREAGTRPRVFCASMADVFEDRPELFSVRGRLWDLIFRTPELDWLLLTKRPQNISGMVPWVQPWANVWLGTTVEDQQRADERIPHLLATPAAVRFLSCEPLLGPVNLDSEHSDGIHALGCGDPYCLSRDVLSDCRGVDWVIIGGESGPGARPMHPQWARSIRDQCQAAGVPFFFKQWGGWKNGSDFGGDAKIVLNDGRVLNTADEADSATRVRWTEFAPTMMRRVGKKAAGRLLDGREWNEFPRASV